ncbi:MAG: hypothetical protein ACREDU_00110, partial [Methylocella sp.]
MDVLKNGLFGHDGRVFPGGLDTMNAGNADGFDHRALQGAAPRRGKTLARAKTSEGEKPGAFTAFGLRAEAEPIRPGLHVVATPIGNLGDISFR